MEQILILLLLGLIQGLTEYLPVSSSGHIELGKVIFQFQPKEPVLLTVILHAATALSTVVVLRKEILAILRGLLQMKWNESTQFSLFIVVSMIPAALIGFFFEEQMEVFFSGNLLLVGFCLLISSSLLFAADQVQKSKIIEGKKVGLFESAMIGIAQAIALLPGVSRSGATISTTLLLGVDRKQAAQFSFLMVLPLIFGKMAKDLLDGNLSFSNEEAIPYAVGFFTAFLVGIWACRWMIQLVSKGRLLYFSIYCLIVGLIAIIAYIYL